MIRCHLKLLFETMFSLTCTKEYFAKLWQGTVLLLVILQLTIDGLEAGDIVSSQYLQDGEPIKNLIDNVDVLITKSRIKRAALDFEVPEYKWNKHRISWRILNYPSAHTKMSPFQVYIDVEKAFKIWSDYAPLEFVVCNDKTKDADISISFQKGAHGDGAPFDGPMGVRAHAFHPVSNEFGKLSGDIHLDDDEIFTHRKTVINGTTNLKYVLVHEIGHSLGLYHSNNHNSVMQPGYDGYALADSKLPLPDARAIQKLYGKKPGIPDLPPTTPPPSTIPPPPPFDCKTRDYAAAAIRGCLLLFQDDRLWRFGRESLTSQLYSTSIGKLSRPYFEMLPRDIGSAFTLYNGTTVFMRGKNMWMYNLHDRVDAKYPMRTRRIYSVPKNIDAAFHSPRIKVTYFFKGKKMWKYDHREGGKPEKSRATREFKGLPTDLSAAYEDEDGNRFFMKKDMYWKYEYKDNQIAEGYPKMFPSNVC